MTFDTCRNPVYKNQAQPLLHHPMQAVQYAPQRGSSCCPSCILYCLAVLTDTTVSLCPRDVMEAILSTAWDTYTLVRGTSGHRFLQQHEVFAALRLPSGIRVREMYGTSREDLACKESRSVFIGDLHRRIRDRSALVMRRTTPRASCARMATSWPLTRCRRR